MAFGCPKGVGGVGRGTYVSVDGGQEDDSTVHHHKMKQPLGITWHIKARILAL
jgi:hypothetical protein